MWFHGTKETTMYRTALALTALMLAFSISAAAAPQKPKSVIHVVTVSWKAATTPAQIQTAVRGVETMDFPGLTRVWTRPIKMQLPEGYKHIIVMEFESEEALKKYADSPAQKKWYEVYLPIREESRTHDITN
jgi:hypothetical protein